MKTLIRISLTLVVALSLVAGEVHAQGRRGQRGTGLQRMTGSGACSSYGFADRAGRSQQQMMQRRYRGGQLGARNRTQPGLSRRGSAAAGGPLTQQEIQSILLMREEEKLARDVYLALGNKWSVPIFSNIARSESRHMAAIEGLVKRHGLQDSVVDDTPGVFINPKFGRLYDDLVRAGSASAKDAYLVGVKIEELDIADLEEGLAAVTSSDVQRVYRNLLRASQNHLTAFRSHLGEDGQR